MTDIKELIRETCIRYGSTREMLMDIVSSLQQELGHVPRSAYPLIAEQTLTHRVEVESVISFYSFLSEREKGRCVIRLCDDVIDTIKGGGAILNAFRKELGVDVGEATPDGLFSLEKTACIGMSDQAPAMLVNDVVVTNLTPQMVPDIIKKLRQTEDPQALVGELGEGNNAHPLIRSMVLNNIRMPGEVHFDHGEKDAGLQKALCLEPSRVISEIKVSGLRGRGGAGFPAGLKWELTRKAEGAEKFVLCNADEGEPGTFKDRVLLTEQADLMLEGMTIAAYAIGAEKGIIYLRAEYAYLRPFLEDKLRERRDKKLLGIDILDREGFCFDIRIQMGAGSYVCGEETSLISSCEGKRGDPTDRTPFPVEQGYMVSPTAVNNVETYCCAARIMEKGGVWFSSIGTEKSTGTKLLSMCGDCDRPGIYEVPFGTRVEELLKLAGAENTAAVVVGGPSGQIIDSSQFGRSISYEDLSTGGAMMVFNAKRDILGAVQSFMEFFEDESCGYCVPCRVGNVLLSKRLAEIRCGDGCPGDLVYLRSLGESVERMSRCGLGQTSPNPILSTLKNFPQLYSSLVVKEDDGLKRSFHLSEAVQDAATIVGRKEEA